jgi:hypothetical protein
MSVFPLFFLSTKLENSRVEQVLPVGVVRKEGRRVNMVQKFVHMYVNAKMITVETIPGMGGRRG